MLPTFANEEEDSAVTGALSYKIGAADEKTVREYADTKLCEGAGIDSEWMAMTLAQLYDTDLSKYAGALEKYVSENEEPSATTREKFALALIAAGSDSDTAGKLLKDSVGGQGIMSYVFALHIINNGVCADGVSEENVVREILDVQLDDGGWAVIGEYGDIDVTAMVLESFAPLYGQNSEVTEASDKGLDFLSSRQLDDGGFMSMGAENSESSAQVVCALSCLGIDCEADERFIKNGSTPVAALLSYRLDSGAFSHISGEDANETATTQALYALVSHRMMKNGEGSFFVFDRERKSDSSDEAVSEGSSDSSVADSSESESSGGDSHEKKSGGYKPIVIGSVLGAGLIVCVILIAVGKKSWKNFVFIAVICGGICAFIAFTDIKTKDEYFSDSSRTETKIVGTVTMSVRCDTIAGEGGKVPDDGTVIDKAEYKIHKGDTVYDVLVSGAKKNEVLLDTKGTKNVYVSGIAGIYEFDFGDLSGWVYHVNGESASVGASSYELHDGDNIEWLYTRNIEKDLN